MKTVARAPTVMEDENRKLKSKCIEFTISYGSKETQTVIEIYRFCFELFPVP